MQTLGIIQRYYCEACQYTTIRPGQWEKHLNTKKHGLVLDRCGEMPVLKTVDITAELNLYVCYCGRKYRHRQSLFKHRQICHINEETNADADLYHLLLENIKETKEIKERVDEIATRPVISNTTITNNTQNNHISINVFLNDYCKDAMTIGDFMKMIQPSIEDIMYMTQHGNKEGIYNILKNALNEMEVTERPMHCTDVKRHSTYVKEEEGWIMDKDQMQLMRLCGHTDHACVKKMVEIIQENPNYQECGTREYEEGIRMMMEVNGGRAGTTHSHGAVAKSLEELVRIDKTDFDRRIKN